MKIEITKEWQDDLGVCPSQCYLYMRYKERYFVIYLRWRYDDPWQATLVECDDDYSMFNKKYEWLRLDVEHWTHDQLDRIKINAFVIAKKIIYRQ